MSCPLCPVDVSYRSSILSLFEGMRYLIVDLVQIKSDFNQASFQIDDSVVLFSHAFESLTVTDSWACKIDGKFAGSVRRVSAAR